MDFGDDGIDETYGNINEIDENTSFIFFREFANHVGLYISFLNGNYHHAECYIDGDNSVKVRCFTVHNLRKFFYMFMIEEEIIL